LSAAAAAGGNMQARVIKDYSGHALRGPTLQAAVDTTTPPHTPTVKTYSAAAEIKLLDGTTIEVLGPPAVAYRGFSRMVPIRIPEGAVITRFQSIKYTPPKTGEAAIGEISQEGPFASRVTAAESKAVWWYDSKQLASLAAPVAVTPRRGLFAAIVGALALGSATVLTSAAMKRPNVRRL
jgi:hypothetical protein